MSICKTINQLEEIVRLLQIKSGLLEDLFNDAKRENDLLKTKIELLEKLIERQQDE